MMFMSKIDRRTAGLVALAAGLLGGCATVGPDYTPPEPPSPPTWTGAAIESDDEFADEAIGRAVDARIVRAPTDPVELAAWWRRLDDPLLASWVERALVDSPDVAAAAARLRRARALLVIEGAEGRPVVDAVGSATYFESGDAALGTGGGATGGATGGFDGELYSAGFDAGWELDLFGRVRRAVEAARAEVAARAYDLVDVRTSLAAEVAGAYVDLRTFQRRLDLAVANRDAQDDTLALASSRFEAGLVSRLDVEQARTNLERTRSQIPALRAGIERSANRLLVLAGEAPGGDQNLRWPAPIPDPPAALAIGVPAEALRRRPDVRAAERRLAAETARVGVATAELYPRFRLAGSIGVQAPSLGDLDADAGVLSVGPSVSWRLFDRRAVRAGIEAQDATQAEALAAWESTVLLALEEAESSLIGYAEEEAREASLERAVDAASRAADLARDLYRSGLRDFQDVLDAQRTLLDLQDQLAVSRGSAVVELIRLYKALGGGWTPIEPSSNSIPSTEPPTASPGEIDR